MKKILSLFLSFIVVVLPCSVNASASGIKKLIKSSYFSVDTSSKTYTGKAIKPTVKSSLKLNTDYSVSYSNNKNVGTATVTIKGVGNYTGTVKKTFKITAKKIKLSDFNFSKTSFIYNKRIKPSVTSSLKLNTDYTVSYSNNKNVGTATVTIKGKGNYTGTIKKTFKITAKKIKSSLFSLSGTSFTYTSKAIKPTVNSSLKLNTDYTVSYSNNKNVGTATVTIKGKGNYTGTVKKTFKITAKKIKLSDFNLSADIFEYTGKAIKPTVKSSFKLDTDYKVEYDNNYELGTAKVIITGKGNCTGTVTKTFKIIRRTITKNDFTNSFENETYTGEEIKPSIRGKLLEGEDYTVSYSNNVNVGTATVTIKGKGNYTGTVTFAFYIVAKELKSGDFSLETASYTYTGNSIKPTILSDLILNKDYTVSYSNNINVGTATVTIKGVGNYTGATSKTFKITAKSISSSLFSLSGTSFTYTSNAIKPTVNSSLKLNTDYTVSYSNNVNVGTATVTIKGKGNYSGTVTFAFYIVAPTVSKVTGLTLTVSDKKIKNKWTKVTNATGYEVWRKSKTNTTYTKVKTVTDGTSYTTNNLVADKYYVKVRAYVKIGSTKFYGSFSDVKSATIK